MQWKESPALIPMVRGKKGELIQFNNEQEMLNYLKKELGGYC